MLHAAGFAGSDSGFEHDPDREIGAWPGGCFGEEELLLGAGEDGDFWFGGFGIAEGLDGVPEEFEHGRDFALVAVAGVVGDGEVIGGGAEDFWRDVLGVEMPEKRDEGLPCVVGDGVGVIGAEALNWPVEIGGGERRKWLRVLRLAVFVGEFPDFLLKGGFCFAFGIHSRPVDHRGVDHHFGIVFRSGFGFDRADGSGVMRAFGFAFR